MNFGRFFRLLSVYLVTSTVALSSQTVPSDIYSGLKWRLIGPFRGGRSVAVTGIPGNSTTFYFGAVQGGIWQTTDAGVVWKPIFDGQHVASIGALAIAPSNPKVIYAGTGESDIRSNLSSGDGVYKSIDGGQTWMNVGLRETRQISKIVVDPKNADVVYVAALGHAYASNPDRGVYKSTDGGASWTKVLDQGPDIGASDLAIAINNPSVLFAMTWNARRPPWSTYAPLGGPGGGLFRSTDRGETWSHLIGHGLPDGNWARSAVAVSPDGKRVYALISANQSGLYRSGDGGENWTLQNSDSRLTSRSWYFGNITVDPKNPDVVYIPTIALYRTEDGGKTISIVRGAPGGDDYHQLWIDPQDSNRMILGTDQGVTISVDCGKTWSSWYNQPTAQLYHVTTDDRFPYAVYGNQQDSGAIAVLSRTDHGQIAPRDWFTAGGSEAGYVAVDPLDPAVLYVSGTQGIVERFDTHTSFSQDITPWPMPMWNTEINERKYRDPWAPVLLFSSADKKALFLGTQFVMKTTDGGLHWQTISPDLTGATTQDKKPEGPPTVENTKQRGYGVVTTIAPSPLKADLIWAGSDTGLIHITRDGGKTWQDVTPKGVGNWSEIALLEASHFDPAVAFASVDRHRLDDQTPYLYRTRDYGASWQPIADGISAPAFLRVLREDPQSKGLLFAGTEMGVSISFDEGDHWQSLQQNLPTVSVQDMVIHGDDLIAATHGRSFWILDNITSLRQTSDAVNAQTAWLFRPSVAVRVDNDTFPGTPLPPEEPSAENPPNGAVIDYYLKEPANRVKLEIVDANQHPVSSFSSQQSQEPKHPPLAIAERWIQKPSILEKAAGSHRFVWDLAWGKAAKDDDQAPDDDEYSVPRGPRVSPGTYLLRLSVDGVTRTQPLKVAMDPRSKATPDELKQQYELGQQIFLEVLRGRQVAAEIKKVQKQLAGLEQKPEVKSAALSVGLTKVKSEIDRIIAGDAAVAERKIGLEKANSGVVATLRVVESSDRAIPSQAMDVYHESDQALNTQLQQWNQLKATLLPQMNEQLKQHNLLPIAFRPGADEGDDAVSQ